jgi:uncharacterized protein involved in outer membrane biogenesis
MRLRINRRNFILGSILVLILAVGGGAMAVRTLCDPVSIEARAKAKVLEKWGKELTMGSLEVKPFPRPVLTATDVAVKGMGRAERVTATLQLFPLLFGRVRPAQVVAEGATLDDPKGKDDWRVDRASFDSALDWRGVTVEATVSRNGQSAHVTGKFADLSNIGHRGERTRGKIEVEWGETRASADGEFRLDGKRGHAFKAMIRTGSLDDVFAFFGVDRERTAPLEVTADVQDDGEHIRLDDIHLRLGAMHASGAGTIDTSADKPFIEARLSADRLDWKQALEDMGHAQKAKQPSEFIFREKPLAWKTLAHLRGLRGKVETEAKSARLGNGIELQEPRARFTFDDDRLELNIWQARLLGGTGHGSMRFDGTAKSIRFVGVGEAVLLQRWFHERGRDHHFTGGPMQVRMTLDMHGDTWRDLASTVTGPVAIRMGRGVYDRQKAGDWEALMAAFSKKNSTGQIDFECAAGNLRFDNGVARGDNIVGARSTMSRLLTSGVIDMREEHVDLRGKLHTRPDAGVGLATIADDLQIEGPLRKMTMRLEPGTKPKIFAKALAAVATLGVSVAATSAEQASHGDTDPCGIVPARKTDQTAMTSSR